MKHPYGVAGDNREYIDNLEKNLNWSIKKALETPYYKFLSKTIPEFKSYNFSINDLSKIPVMTRKNMRTHQDLKNGYVGTSRVSIYDSNMVVAECGTHAEPILYCKTKDDVNLDISHASRAFSVSIKENDKVALFYPFVKKEKIANGRPYTLSAIAGPIYKSTVENLNAISIKKEFEINGHDQKINVISGFPWFMIQKIREKQKEGYDFNEWGAKKLLLTGEPYRKEHNFDQVKFLQNVFGIEETQLFDADAGALGEAYECEVTMKNRSGMHVNPGNIIEFTDNDGNIVGDGEWGNITVTKLHPVGNNPGSIKLRRQIKGKMSRFLDYKCECRRETPLIDYPKMLRPSIAVVAMEPEYFERRVKESWLSDHFYWGDMKTRVNPEDLTETLTITLVKKNENPPNFLESEIMESLVEVDEFLEVAHSKGLGEFELEII